MNSMGGIADFFRGSLATLVTARLPCMLRFLVSYRRDVIGAVVAAGAVTLILVNGLFLQSGPHPAPIFAIKPLPVVSNEPTGAVLPRPRPPTAESARFDPVPTPRPRVQPAASRTDPIAELINPPRPLSAVQRALNEYGYGRSRRAASPTRPPARRSRGSRRTTICRSPDRSHRDCGAS
jgi:hypothetical protein